MAIRAARQFIGRIFTQRCFYLFIVLLAFDGVVPFFTTDERSRFAISIADSFVAVAAVAAVGRTALSFVIVSLLAGGTLLFYWLSVYHEDAAHLACSWGFAAALDLATIAYLLRYVYRPEVMTADKLFGATAAYLLLGSFWAGVYALLSICHPDSFSGVGAAHNSDLCDYLYFSYTALTNTGFGDIVPKTRQARALCNLEQLSGVLYLAILIARLTGVYPPMPKEKKGKEPANKTE
jgi:hypothetical protein